MGGSWIIGGVSSVRTLKTHLLTLLPGQEVSGVFLHASLVAILNPRQNSAKNAVAAWSWLRIPRIPSFRVLLSL